MRMTKYLCLQVSSRGVQNVGIFTALTEEEAKSKAKHKWLVLADLVVVCNLNEITKEETWTYYE